MQDTNYFSDSEHHLSTGSYSGGGGSGARRIRNRHMSGLDAALAAVSGGGPPLPGTLVQLDLTTEKFVFGLQFDGSLIDFHDSGSSSPILSVKSIWATPLVYPSERLI